MPHRHSPFFYLLFTAAVAVVLGVAVFTYAWLAGRGVEETQFGITFSSMYALQLGHDPIEMYRALLDDLDVRRVRVPLYWSDIEREKGVFDWSMPDALVALSQEHGASLTLVVGMKVPRWPECFVPDWAETHSPGEQHQYTLAFIEQAVRRYRDSSAVARWQVENEPFFPFGQCPKITPRQFDERVEIVRSLDDRPIQATVSGELGSWRDSARAADVLGISLYRQTWNDTFGHFIYPLTPDYYRLRAALVRDQVEDVVVSELQAEPWFPEPIAARPMLEWYDAFTAQAFVNNVAFARDAGFAEAYLWGAEWWYALKKAGDDRLWEAARGVLTQMQL